MSVGRVDNPVGRVLCPVKLMVVREINTTREPDPVVEPKSTALSLSSSGNIAYRTVTEKGDGDGVEDGDGIFGVSCFFCLWIFV